MNAGMQDARQDAEAIVDQFTQWVKALIEQAQSVQTEDDLQQLEQQVRDDGQNMLNRLLNHLVQQAVKQAQEPARTCPHCKGRRRHQGVRRRRVLTSLGQVTVTGVYWRCPDCGLCGHTAEGIAPDSLSGLLRQLTRLLGVSLASFHKAEVVAEALLGVKLDAETLRRRCMAEGWQAARDADADPPAVKPGETLIGSCDGTMVRTRESDWREVKGYRFEHSGGRFGGAALEPAETFSTRLQRAADRLGQQHAGRRVFVSDMAAWIEQAVERELPGWLHIGDFWHATQHLHAAGKAVYGDLDPRARKWAVYWSRRLKRHGAAAVADRMRRTVLLYPELRRQSELLKLIRFLDRHAAKMDYANYQRDNLPIGSGPMESFCKQLGRRMKGPGTFWCVRNVTPMATLVARWSMDPEGFAGVNARRGAA